MTSILTGLAIGLALIGTSIAAIEPAGDSLGAWLVSAAFLAGMAALMLDPEGR
jgi:hypothetical protein